MSEPTQIILDPTAHQHRTGRVWQSCQRECLRRLAPAEVSLVEGAEAAEQAARVGALKGFRKFIIVGGGEAAHGVVNGLMSLAQAHRDSIVVGMLSIVRPDDWSRTLGFPRRLTKQVQVLEAGHTLPIDLGRVDLFSHTGVAASRYFLNGAEFGVLPRIRHELRGNRQAFQQTMRGIAGAVGDLIANRRPVVKIEGESGRLYEGPCPVGLVMGGRYYPALGEVAPESSPSDGVLDAVWYASSSRLEMFSRLLGLVPIVRRGATPPGRDRSGWFQVTAPGEPVHVEADGILLGRLPATFTVEPRALAVIVPQVAARLKKPKFAPLPKPGEGGLVGHYKLPVGF